MNNSGVFDKYSLIDSIIQKLDKVETKGYQNMKWLTESIEKLACLSQGLKEEEKRANDINRDENV